MRRSITRILLIAASGGLLAPIAADEIVFTTGERREGRVEEVAGDPSRIAFITGAGRVELPRGRVEEVIEQPDYVDYTILGNQYLKSRGYPTALQMFQKAIEIDPEYAPAQQGMMEAQAKLQEQQRERQNSVIEENSGMLAAARDAIEAEEFEDAKRILERIEERGATDEQMGSISILKRDLYLAWGLSRYDRLDTFGAEDMLQKVLELDPNNMEAEKVLLQIWERVPSKRPQVLDAYRRQLAADPDNLELNRKVGELLYQMNQYEESLDPLEKVVVSGRYRGQEYNTRLMKALEFVVRDRTARGDLDGAIAAYERMSRIFSNVDPTTLVYLQYEKALNGLEPDDWDGRAALLKELEKAGLRDFAIGEARTILSNDSDNEVATAYLRADAAEKLQEVQATFNSGQYIMAKSRAEKFAKEYIMFSDLAVQATDIYSKASVEAERQLQRVREQATNIAEQGNEYLSLAYSYAEKMKSEDQKDNTFVLNNKAESIKNVKRAIEAYEVALKLDSSLGPLTGMDLNTKLADARALYGRLTASPVPRRPIDRRSRI